MAKLKRGRPIAFKTQLKKWRTDHKVKRSVLASALGVPYRTLEDWEAGRRTPTGLTKRLILEQLAHFGTGRLAKH